MDLSALGSTLPPGLADAERDMGDKFRAAALSITNLYKSAKQATHVGYSAALDDVLSTVQSSIGAGQNAEQTLSRLMDWADARQAAISAFAAENDDLPAPSKAKPSASASASASALSRPSLNHLGPQPYGRAASVPVPEHQPSQSQAGPSLSRSAAKERLASDTLGSSSRIGMGMGMMSASTGTAGTSTSTPNTSLDSMAYQPTPGDIMSSSPGGSPSIRHTQQILAPKPSKGLPLRFAQPRSETSSIPSVPSTSFNPALPSMPFVSFDTPLGTSSVSGPAPAPAQNYNTGDKRPMIEAMEVENPSPPSTIPPTGVAVAVSASAPTTPASQSRGGGRASKRRSMGVRKDEEDEGKERRRGGKRHGGQGAPA